MPIALVTLIGVLPSLIALLLVPVAAHGQRTDILVASLDVGVAAGLGGGDYRAREGVFANAMVERFGTPHAPWVFAIDAGAQGFPSGGDDCELTPQGACRADFPIFYALSLRVGRQWGNRQRAFGTISAGPSVLHADGGGSVAGISLRIQQGTRLWGPLVGSLVARSSFIPRYRGSTITLGGLGIGISARL